MPAISSQIRLSPSALSLYRECPRCFYLQKTRGIHRPPLNFALQSNIDRILKPYFDGFRKKGQLPPELEGKVEGKLFPDQELLDQWRNNFRPALRYHDERFPNFFLVGAIDDCLINEDGFYLTVDYKTTGGSNFEENSKKYYQHQLDIYNFLLEQNGFKTKGVAYLVYYKPEEILDAGVMKFRTVVKEMETSHERAEQLFVEGISLLQGPMPDSHSTCQFCSWGNDIAQFD